MLRIAQASRNTSDTSKTLQNAKKRSKSQWRDVGGVVIKPFAFRVCCPWFVSPERLTHVKKVREDKPKVLAFLPAVGFLAQVMLPGYGNITCYYILGLCQPPKHELPKGRKTRQSFPFAPRHIRQSHMYVCMYEGAK